MNIRETINRYIDDRLDQHELYSVVGEVVFVDTDALTCEVSISGKANVKGVSYSQGSISIEPKVGSDVILTFINPVQAFINYVATPNKLEVTVNDSKVTFSDKIVFDSGGNGGLVLSEAVSSNINSLISELNNLKTILTSWTPVPGDGGGALKILITNWATGVLQPTVKTDFENTKIEH